jgi:hypothetical protein
MNISLITFYVSLILYLTYRKHKIRAKFLETTKLLKRNSIDKSIKKSFMSQLDKYFDIKETNFDNLDTIAKLLFDILSIYIIFNGLAFTVDTIITKLFKTDSNDNTDLNIVYMKLYIKQGINERGIIEILKNSKNKGEEYHREMCYICITLLLKYNKINEFPNTREYIYTEYPKFRNIKLKQENYKIISNLIDKKDGLSINKIIETTSENDIKKLIKDLEIEKYSPNEKDRLLNDPIFQEMYELHSKVCRVNKNECKRLGLKYHPDKAPLENGLQDPKKVEEFKTIDKLYKIMESLYF